MIAYWNISALRVILRRLLETEESSVNDFILYTFGPVPSEFKFRMGHGTLLCGDKDIIFQDLVTGGYGESVMMG